MMQLKNFANVGGWHAECALYCTRLASRTPGGSVGARRTAAKKVNRIDLKPVIMYLQHNYDAIHTPHVIAAKIIGFGLHQSRLGPHRNSSWQ